MRLGVLGRWDDPYLTMSAQYEAVIAGAFVEFLDRGYVYKGLKPVNWCIHDRTALAEAEVEYENHTSPSIWVRFALTSDPAQIDPALAGPQGLRPDLDHHALDHPGQHGHRLPSEVRIRRGGSGRRRVHRRRGSAEGHRGKAAAGSDPKAIAAFPGREARRRHLPPSVSGARFARHPGRPRDARTGHRRGPHRSRPRPGRLRQSAASTASPIYCPVDRRRPLLSRRRRGRPPARRDHRQDRVGSQPDRHRDSEIARRAAGARRRSSTAIRTAGAATTPTIFRATEQWFIGMERNDLRASARWKPSST